jgi:hypothetical protein
MQPVSEEASLAEETEQVPAISDEAIYRDVLVFEEAVRAQYLTLQKRKRKYLIFILSLVTWILYFAYGVFINPSKVST